MNHWQGEFPSSHPDLGAMEEDKVLGGKGATLTPHKCQCRKKWHLLAKIGKLNMSTYFAQELNSLVVGMQLGDANGRRPLAFVSIMEGNLSMVVPRSTEAVSAGILATRNRSICRSSDCSRIVVDIDILLQ